MAGASCIGARGGLFGIVILSKNNWPLIKDKIDEVVDAVSRASPGEIIEIEI